VLSPPSGWMPKRVSNNDSVVLRLTYGGRSILLPGDVEARMERRLVEEGADLASDVLKVAHHGSRTSSTPEFLSRVAPRFGVISVGAFKRFGHPNDDVLAALATAGIRMYRTDRDGAVTISTDGRRLDVTAYRDALKPWPAFVSQ
jgi:competence protein ComEC